MSLIFAEGQDFYPCHPSPERTRQIQTAPSPMLEGQSAHRPKPKIRYRSRFRVIQFQGQRAIVADGL